jgi:outer membrane receptor protein involved in Fe transport
VINPRSISWLRNFAFTVDYFNIDIQDAIVPTPRQFILNQCYVANVPEFCEFIIRRPEPEGPNSPGSLEFINSSATNSGGFKTEGVDVTASYRQNLEDWGLDGNLNMRVSWTHVLEGYIIPLPGAARNEFNREVGGSRNKVFAQAAYTLNEFTGILRGNYVGPAYLDDQFTGFIPGDDGSEDFKVGAEFILDAQLRWAPGDNYEFYFGVDNVLDNEPPLIPTGLSNGDTGTETNAGTYDSIGRRYYAGATLKF